MSGAGARLSSPSSLAVGSAPWRAGRAAAVLLSWREGAIPTDTALGALEGLGAPDGGWWDVMGHIRKGGLQMRLPRAGDPRGVALPRSLAVDGLIGWPAGDAKAHGSVWLAPVDAPTRGIKPSWRLIDLPGQDVRFHDLRECSRNLRTHIVRAAHILDMAESHPQASGLRKSVEGIVDSWILGPPALPAERRSLAAQGLGLILAMDQTRTPNAGIDTRDIERASRDAVEAAYSSSPSPG